MLSLCLLEPPRSVDALSYDGGLSRVTARLLSAPKHVEEWAQLEGFGQSIGLCLGTIVLERDNNSFSQSPNTH